MSGSNESPEVPVVRALGVEAFRTCRVRMDTRSPASHLISRASPEDLEEELAAILEPLSSLVEGKP